MRNNLTKKEVHEANAFELVLRFDFLIDKGEKLSASEISVADARELIWIEDELRERLIKLLGRDFYPPDYPPMICKTMNLEIKSKGKIKFKVVINNSMGTKVAEHNIDVDSKSEANSEVRKMIRKLGLRGATYKLS